MGYAIGSVQAVQACSSSAPTAMPDNAGGCECSGKPGMAGQCSLDCAPLCAAATGERVELPTVSDTGPQIDPLKSVAMVTSHAGPEPPPPRSARGSDCNLTIE